MDEKRNIEWKRSWHDDYLKWVCGFANAVGGIIYIGKDDNESVVHLEDYKKLMENIPNKIRDINEKSIVQFIEDSKEKGRMPDSNGLTTLQILDKLRFIENNKLKRGALVLFGNDPNRFSPNIIVKIGRFGKDGSDLKFQEVIEGNIVQLLKEVQVQLNHKFLVRKVDFAGMHRIEEGEYPVAALREMLLNALVHRSYMGAAIQVRVFDSKLSIWNEGGLPNGLELESLKGDHNSRPRNPKIADTCFKAGYIDAWGRGTLKIINSCKDAGLPEPEIIEIDGGIQVTIYKAVDGGQEYVLTERQKEVFNLIVDNPRISRSQLANELGINESAVQKHIEALKKKKAIERKSETTGFWTILLKRK